MQVLRSQDMTIFVLTMTPTITTRLITLRFCTCAWGKSSRGQAFAHSIDDLVEGEDWDASLLSSIQSACTSMQLQLSVVQLIHSTVAIYNDQGMRINVQLTFAYHACFIPTMLGALAPMWL